MTGTIGLAEGGGERTTAPSETSGGGTIKAIYPGNPIVRPIGISPSIGTASGEDWFRGNQWPPENTEPPSASPSDPWPQSRVRHFTPVTHPNGPGQPFEVTLPPRAWDPAYYQLVLLAEFAQNWTPQASVTAHLETMLSTALTDAHHAAERRDLFRAIEFRAGVQSEVLAQMDSFDAYFRGALGYAASSYPCTDYLVQGAMRIGELVVMYYKNLFQRPRPLQLWPQLMPPVLVPGHASFPSGHATQSHTIAKVLQAVAAGVVPEVTNITTRLAQRIARGREVLGLHYPSDSAAGEYLADHAATVYLSGSTASRLVDAAKEEWAAYTV